MHDESEPLFPSAEAALRWALSDERVALQQSGTYRSPGSGRGLSGFDGAGQAGIILSQVRALGSPRSMILTAQVASAKLRAPECRHDGCCGWHSNPVWVAAVRSVADWWLSEHPEERRRERLVIGCLRRFFGEHVSVEAIAKRNGLHRTTVSEFNGALLAPIKPLKEAAWREIEGALMGLRLIPGAETPAIA